jgi:omega-amidase
LGGPDGEFLAKHRKVHLFDVDLPGGVSFKESVILSPGHQITVVPVLGMSLGIAVCYDIRFPELARLMTLKGADMIALPGAFNHVSGPAHWEILLRNRASENTVWVAGVSGMAPPEASYQAWGHSMLADPFGDVVADMGRAQGVAFHVMDPARLKDVRARLPVLKQRRDDLYSLTLNSSL